ncbi:hypothetical protein [Arvimicrobium flavum]|uniref:hypothetical protein n=1 Tax=Arvimicrobium flavum TaxID=3393320 RepID=UPI00237BDB0F|nr:hypothetical protein [Mesorhizobium shangrilense]
MTDDHPFIAGLRHDAKACQDAEDEFRRTMNTRVAELAEARAFANRRMNLMRSLFDVVARAGQSEIAVAGAVAALRTRLGWHEDSDARDEVLTEYARLAAAAFTATHPREGDDAASRPGPDVARALADFETWYLAARGKPFWVLFEHYMPETQLVDF